MKQVRAEHEHVNTLYELENSEKKLEAVTLAPCGAMAYTC